LECGSNQKDSQDDKSNNLETLEKTDQDTIKEENNASIEQNNPVDTIEFESHLKLEYQVKSDSFNT